MDRVVLYISKESTTHCNLNILREEGIDYVLYPEYGNRRSLRNVGSHHSMWCRNSDNPNARSDNYLI